MPALSLALDLVALAVDVSDFFLANLAGWTIMGFGIGIFLHSLGSVGGVDIVAINSNQNKRLEAIAFHVDDNALMIAANTFNVLGRGFSKRKV